MDLEVKEKLDAHEDKLSEHDSRIKDLEIGKAKTDQLLSNIQENQKEFREDIRRLENITLNHQNTMLTSINQLLTNKNDNETKKEIADKESDIQKQIADNQNFTTLKTKVIWGAVIIISALISGGLVGKFF